MKGGCVMADETAADTGGRESLAYELAVWRAEVERTASELGAWIGKPGRTPEPVAKAYDALTVLLARDGATAADDVNEANKYAYQAGEALHSSRRDRDAWRARAEKAENELRGVRADLEAAREEIRHTRRRLEDRERDVRILRTAMVAAGGDLKDAIRADMDGDRADAVRRAADELDKGLQSAGVANRPNPAAPLPSVPEPSVTYADLERVARRMAAMLENIPEDFRPDEPKGMSVADVGERLALAVARLVTAHHEHGRELEKLRSELQAVMRNQAKAAERARLYRERFEQAMRAAHALVGAGVPYTRPGETTAAHQWRDATTRVEMLAGVLSRMNDEPAPDFATLCRDLVTHRADDGDGGCYWEVETVARRMLAAVGLPVSRPASADDEKGTDEPEPDGDDVPTEPDATAAAVGAISRRLANLTELVLRMNASIGKLTDAVGLLTARAVGKPLAEVDPVAARGREVLARFRSLEERARRAAMERSASDRRPFVNAINMMTAFLKSWEDNNSAGRPLAARANADGAERSAELVCGHLEEKYDAGAYKIPDDFRG